MSCRCLIKHLPIYLIFCGLFSISVGMNVIYINRLHIQSNMINRIMTHITYMNIINNDTYKNNK
jgi:hypothetical protein